MNIHRAYAAAYAAHRKALAAGASREEARAAAIPLAALALAVLEGRGRRGARQGLRYNRP